MKRNLFNAFASYLLRYRGEVHLSVNGEELNLDEFIEQSKVEDIDEAENVPAARLHHLLLGPQVDQPAPCVLQFAAHGASIRSQSIDVERVPGKKYLGLVDSAYLSELTNTAKSELATMDTKFVALEMEATRRAKGYILAARGNHTRTFLEEARAQPFYPFKEPPKTPLDGYSRNVFDNLLLSIEEEVGISTLSPRQQRLVFGLIRQSLQSEDLASVLTSVLALKGEHVTRLAELLKTTTLSSIIAVSELLVGRCQFLDELQALVYGKPAEYVKERKHLHKIIETHTWLFGEQYNLMGSDNALKSLLPVIQATVSDVDDDDDSRIDVDEHLRDIPDLYLLTTQWNEGARYHQHLIVEMKRPSVRIVPKHVDQLERYARQIVKSPVFGQGTNNHRFTFVLVSSEVSQQVKETKYQEGAEPGFLGKPKGLGHPTELWTLQWSDCLDRRREELRFLQDRIEVTTDPEALEYLRRKVGDYLPAEVMANHLEIGAGSEQLEALSVVIITTAKVGTDPDQSPSVCHYVRTFTQKPWSLRGTLPQPPPPDSLRR